MAMTISSMDRRSARTRARLQHALNALILRKDYEAITTSEICRAARVGRSRFYGHYRGKDDLKLSCIDHRLRRQLRERRRHSAAPCRDRPLAFSLPMLEHARGYRDHYRALAGGRGGALSLDKIRAVLSDLVRAELSAAAGRRAARDAVPSELAVEYVVGAFMAVMTWWLGSGAKLPPAQVDAMFRRLAIEGVLSRAR
jgi:AcrR family transcriptional regulator